MRGERDRIMGSRERVAIVGMGGIFPRSPDLERFWDLIVSARDATEEPPPDRWLLDPSATYDPRIGAPDKVYATRGGFVAPFDLDTDGLAIDAELLGRLDPQFHLALYAARAAWRDARTEALDRQRVGVILGNIVLPTESTSLLARSVLGRTFEERLGVPSEYPSSFEPLNTFAAGLPAGIVAQALGLGGGSFTLDAACASSLYAVKLAVDELLAGRTDAMLAGGLSRPDPLYTQMGFAQLRALAAGGKPRPFDVHGDGLIVGEGAGVFILKRLSDALQQGDTIHGVIAGAGLSNDVDGGLLAPSSEGQLRAMRVAYERAGWDPRHVDLIECHATGTPVGDAVEFASLGTLWGRGGWTPGQCVIGSVKSNIGHALTAAGSAGLLKVLLALKYRVLPPTANFTAPAPGLKLADSPFRVLNESEPWDAPGDRPRRAAISGFGFGGINAHVLIEEWGPGVEDAVVTPGTSPEATPIAIVGIGAHVGPWSKCRELQERVLGGNNARTRRTVKADSDGPSGLLIPPFPRGGNHNSPPWEGGARGGGDSTDRYEARSSATAELAHWWGVESADWYRRQTGRTNAPKGYFIDELALPVDQFRIPPRELEEMLPQQSLMLQVAAEAIRDAGWDDRPRPRAGTFIGIGLDLHTTNFHVRWSVRKEARKWAQQLGLGLEGDAFEAWVESLCDSVGPALSANRTMGALGGLVASRIAREFRIGGPSFTVSSEETSGTRALEIAVHLLRQGELDEAVVGAVDLPGDPRMLLSLKSLAVRANPVGEGAVAFVLKRLEDAERDGDTVYAVIGGIGMGTEGLGRALAEAHTNPQQIGYVDAEAEEADHFLQTIELSHCALASARADVGYVGAASSLVALFKAVACLYQQILPPLRESHTAAPHHRSFVVPTAAQFWLHDRASGPRRALVASQSLDGNRSFVVLAENEPSDRQRKNERNQPLGARHAAVFAIEGHDVSSLLRAVDDLDALAARWGNPDVESLAHAWLSRNPLESDQSLAVTAVATGIESLRAKLSLARTALSERCAVPFSEGARGLYLCPTLIPSDSPREPFGRTSGLAFVYPGLGNLYPGMGRTLSAQWPEILRRQEAESEQLRAQMAPGVFWNEDPPATFADHCAPILGQVAVGSMVTDLLQSFGIVPDAAIGYSLGESVALIALRAWTERDEMYRRLMASPLFRTDLAGRCDAARRAWGSPDTEPAEWLAGVVAAPRDAVDAALTKHPRVYRLIVNTPNEVVIGGEKASVLRFVDELGSRFFPLPVVSSVHCEIARLVEREYYDLHHLKTTPPPGVRFYSGAHGHSYIPNAESAASSIVAHAIEGIDFPRVIEQAYADGVRVFVEVGPGNSCTRLIDTILGDLPHLARPACFAGQDEVVSVLDLLARLIAERVPVDLATLYGQPPAIAGDETRSSDTKSLKTISVLVGGRPFDIATPPPPTMPSVRAPDDRNGHPPRPEVSPPRPRTPLIAPRDSRLAPMLDSSELHDGILAASTARSEAHEAYLAVSDRLAQSMANQLAFQMALVESLMSQPAPVQVAAEETVVQPLALDRDKCLEFAIGSIGAVLGEAFAPIDTHPTRVRLPDEPLMLVDRILTIEGEPCSMSHGRVVTEHDVLVDGWYLDAGRIPPCIAIESGQADLFLSGYLGIDFITKGFAVYRLLDASVTFHRGLPRPGDVIRYDIHIHEFFCQGDTYLFRFSFEADVDGEPLLSMRDGCAGFFTEQELAAGKGIVSTALDVRPMPGTIPDDWEELVPMHVESYDESQIDALRHGDLPGAFGPLFAGLPLHDPARLPSDRMTLVDRVLTLDPNGGRFGLGLIRGEADIHPGDWFMVCHFVDDRVMPGTLMYECCLHTLRIYLTRLGWVGEHDEVAWEPVPGVLTRLRCRGQVIETTQKVVYEIAIKELGYRPEPYAIVDTLMYADGKAIVEFTNMSLQLTGQTRDGLRQIWAGVVAYDPPAALYTREHILAFATGKPSDAFGAPYRVFDEERFIARLPAPPYSFLDRVTHVTGEPFKMAAGGTVVADYDVPPDAWYFDADRQTTMPFAVLLEVALQPCGWMSAYIGSALTNDADLHYRNLGGQAVLLVPVTPEIGTLTTTVHVTKVANSAGMIIQHFDFDVCAGGRSVYRGDTYFGFFRPEALAEQVGIREAMLYRPTTDELGRAHAFAFPEGPPFPRERWRMVDKVDVFVADGGPAGLGFIEGSKRVNPADWFFEAHFVQDPVWPGSLGLESFLQLLKVVADARWGCGPETRFESTALGATHRWVYRGQIIPTCDKVTVQAVITGVDDDQRTLRADGYLSVDGRVIYQMIDFTLGVIAESR